MVLKYEKLLEENFIRRFFKIFHSINPSHSQALQLAHICYTFWLLRHTFRSRYFNSTVYIFIHSFIHSLVIRVLTWKLGFLHCISGFYIVIRALYL